MTTKREKMSRSGWLRIEGGNIHYAERSGGGFLLTFDEIRIIGEYTNQNGPFADDWFLCFLTPEPGWYEVPMYAEGVNELTEALSRRLDAPIEPKLFGSTDFTSRVLWPAHLEGQPLFNFEDWRPAEFWPRVRAWLSPRNIQKVLPAILDYTQTGEASEPRSAFPDS